jgi:hypothetical protein
VCLVYSTGLLSIKADRKIDAQMIGRKPGVEGSKEAFLQKKAFRERIWKPAVSHVHP